MDNQLLTRRAVLRLLAAGPVPFLVTACRGRGGEDPQSAPTERPRQGPSPGPARPPTAELSPAPSPPLVDAGAPSPANASPSPSGSPRSEGNFYTRVIARDSRFDSTAIIKDLGLLEPVTRRKVEAIIAEARDNGLQLMVFETYRSMERQEQLFRQGVTMLKTVGVHHYGLACDIVKNVNGNPSWAGDFSLLGRLAHKHRLIWGGDWGKPDEPNPFPDVVHVQRCSEAKQPELFAGTWYPDENYDPYQA